MGIKCLFWLLLIVSNICFAQSGKITGKIIDASTGQALPSATLILIEKSLTTVADLNGAFSFSKLAPGSYSIKCSYTGYNEKIVEEIVVKDGDITPVTVSLELKQVAESSVVVKTTRVREAGETVSSLLAFRKNTPNVSDFVTAEQIRKTPDRSTGDVIKRISGASIQDDRFAVIRGLNDRYNAALINGAPLPSTESDRKAFAFDIFPSAILDNLIIYKTATPDKTGEFAGGIIDITTKSILPKSFTSISFGGSYNTLSTGKTRLFSENKGKKDWIGIDDGTRAMPAGIPSSNEIRNVLSFAQRAELAKLFGNYKWGVQRGITKANYNIQLSKGINIEKNQKEFLGVLFSVNYNRNYSLAPSERYSFDAPSYILDPADTSLKPLPRGQFKDTVYNDEVIVAALANIGIKINGRNTISWKNNLSINTDNKLITRMGFPDITNDSNNIFREKVRWFTSNQIITSQLNGEHEIGPIKTKINWLASYSHVKREIPNLSRSGGSIYEPINQIGGSGTMFFISSDENIKNAKADITQPYTLLKKRSQNFLKIGAGYQIRKRDFTNRLLGFSRYDDNANGIVFDNSLYALPEDQIFLREHLGVMKNGKGGFKISDGTVANSNYKASSELVHVYLMNDQRYKKFRLIYGLRLEQFNQKLASEVNASQPVNINSTVTDFLPSANLVYALTSKMNFRLSFSNTLNRPEFRELAPFLFFEYQTGLSYEGTQTLKRAKIKNYDFRYEFFPGKAQLMSVSAFYKDFTNPIEIVSLPNTSNQTKYINTSSGKTYGAEAEFRILLSTLFGIKREGALLEKLTLAVNAAYIKSSIKLTDSLLGYGPSQLFKDRALLGQSPYIFNGSLGFNDDKTGFSSTLSVNRVGERIFVAGAYNTPDIYERARTVVDFQVAKFFLNNAFEIKFTAKDILAQNLDFYFDYDRNRSFTDDKDRLMSSAKFPRVFSFSATLKF